MSYLGSVSQFIYDRVLALEAAVINAKSQVQQGKYTLDKFFNDSANLWLQGCDGLQQLVPAVPPDTVTTSFKTVGSGATSFTELISPGPFPWNAPLTVTPLIPLNGGTASGTPSATPQPDGTLKIDIANIQNRKQGDVYQLVIFYQNKANAVHPVAVLVIAVV